MKFCTASTFVKYILMQILLHVTCNCGIAPMSTCSTTEIKYTASFWTKYRTCYFNKRVSRKYKNTWLVCTSKGSNAFLFSVICLYIKSPLSLRNNTHTHTHTHASCPILLQSIIHMWVNRSLSGWPANRLFVFAHTGRTNEFHMRTRTGREADRPEHLKAALRGRGLFLSVWMGVKSPK